MSRERVSLGRQGEELAAEELGRQGYSIIARNWRCYMGEVDLVALRGDTWFFFEVRTRRGRAYGTPEESVTPRKKERMVDVARMYLAENDQNVHEIGWQIGMVAVEMDQSGYLLRIDIYDTLA